MAPRFLSSLFDSKARTQQKRLAVFMACDYPMIVEELTTMIIKDQTRFMGTLIEQSLCDNTYGKSYRFSLTSAHKQAGTRNFHYTPALQYDIPIADMMAVHDEKGGFFLKTARHFADDIHPLWRRHIARARVAARHPASESHL